MSRSPIYQDDLRGWLRAIYIQLASGEAGLLTLVVEVDMDIPMRDCLSPSDIGRSRRDPIGCLRKAEDAE